MNIRLVLALGLIAGPVWAAEDTPEDSPEELRAACFEMSVMMGQVVNCVDQAVGACLEAIPGYKEKGARGRQVWECTAPVAEWWGQTADAEYERALAAQLKMEAEAGDKTQAAEQTKNLKRVHAAWLAYRAAKCNVDVVGLGRGALAPIAAANCWMNESAEHAVFLAGWGNPSPYQR